MYCGQNYCPMKLIFMANREAVCLKSAVIRSQGMR